ncbi:hypothetical protein C5167_010498 [Papaver somniferum]|uniref:Major facilitator superfamily (MFS) profile domain-containing protein n=1 Tax=Papaver somniferum TaxID=3469 RepID=A0A4Y7K1T9_PAPSO|nr:hypothetical protein C5167_010498 [Papaver somniferum]
MAESKMEYERLRHIFVTVFLYNFAVFMVIPAITDVTMLALCPGQDECSLAIYLTGFQQAVTGLGSLMVMPVVGNLSDSYGRKALLTLPMILTILPLAILACGRTKYFFYGYYALKTLTAMFCEGSVLSLSLAYVADNISESRRSSAFGILSGIGSSAFLCGTLTSRFISTQSTFKVSAFVAILATLYMRFFLPDSSCNIDSTSCSKLISSKTKRIGNNVVDDSCPKIQIGKRIPSIDDTIHLLKTSLIFRQAAIVAFFTNLAEGGLREALLVISLSITPEMNYFRTCALLRFQALRNFFSDKHSHYYVVQYFLKARFHFNKDQFADLMLIVGVSGVISQLVLMPILVPGLGEEKLLRIGLLASCVHMITYSISWAPWVPYVGTAIVVLAVFSSPCLRSIASKQVGPEEQGKAQGCISGIGSFANIISPLVFTPLTALFLSDRAPFHFPGFSIMCTGFAMMIAFLQSLMIRRVPTISNNKSNNNAYNEA